MTEKFPIIYDAEDDVLLYDLKMKEYRETMESCPRDKGWRTELLDGPDGWVSPRMCELLIMTADISHDDDDLCDSSLLPSSAESNIGGFQQVLYVIARCAESGPLTIKRISSRIERDYETKEYLNDGGTIEESLDFVLRAAKISLDDGMFDELIEEDKANLPVTPLDEDFDLVRIMAMDKRCFTNVTEDDR